MLDKIRPAGLATAGREDAKKGNALGTHPSNSQYLTPVQAPIRAQLIGSNTCTAAGITARGSVLALCQLLMQVGFNPIRPLHAYRGATLCLVVRSIGVAAGLEINTKGTGFVRHRAVRAGPPMRQKRRGTT